MVQFDSIEIKFNLIYYYLIPVRKIQWENPITVLLLRYSQNIFVNIQMTYSDENYCKKHVHTNKLWRVQKLKNFKLGQSGDDDVLSKKRSGQMTSQ